MFAPCDKIRTAFRGEETGRRINHSADKRKQTESVQEHRIKSVPDSPKRAACE
jgi:hypothetical protein